MGQVLHCGKEGRNSMSFSSMPMKVKEAQEFIKAGGKVVTASRMAYYDNTDWLQDIRLAEIMNDSETCTVRLLNGDFVEFTRTYD
jgi:hypothetical protein